MQMILKYIPVFLTAVALSAVSLPAMASDNTGNAVEEPVEKAVMAAGRIDMDGVILEPLQERDSVLIADQLLYGFVLDDVEEGTAFAFPDYSDGFCEGVEIVSPWKVDTLEVHKGRKGRPSTFDIRAGVTVASFDEGRYELPPVAVLRRTPAGVTDTVFFGNRTLEVCTMPVDTATFRIHDIKGQIRYPLTFKELLPYIGIAALLAGLIVLAVWLIRRFTGKAAEAAMRKDPPHIVALRKLDRFRGSTLWVPDKQKAFYSGVTDALREYMMSRYGISALEKTTAEIFRELSDKDVPDGLYQEMKDLFERADFVKFAKYVASDEENAGVVPSAVRFVTATYQQEVDSAAQSGTEEDGHAGSVPEPQPDGGVGSKEEKKRRNRDVF